ncbi:MAG: hypothetical protein JNJ58_06165 [Chitinophagaceae bacterium]|nr:hypothetical protein [Chitinophagaceae bacterium]
MRILVSILLFALIGSNQCAMLIVTISWNANRDFVSSRLCENIDKPQMQCKGKCQLTKQYQKIHHDQDLDGKGKGKISLHNIDVFIAGSELNTLTQDQTTDHDGSKLSIYSIQYRYNFLHQLIKPPNVNKCS